MMFPSMTLKKRALPPRFSFSVQFCCSSPPVWEAGTAAAPALQRAATSHGAAARADTQHRQDAFGRVKSLEHN